jgi:CubicO group peptidase (beta-lactamase class C family)
MLFSLSKSFTSTAVGFVVAEGRLSVDDPVVSFFPDETPSIVAPNLAAMRVRHLLSMSTGHDADVTDAVTRSGSDDWVRAFLAQPVQHRPSTHFAYNSAATYMLSAIVQRLTGETLLAYLGPRLLTPLGIAGATWQSCPRGVNVGGWGLSIRTEDIAAFGQLYLRRGEWRNQQVVPAAWVEEATRRHVSNGNDPLSDWAQGYGYQFWRCRYDAYRGDGAFGQFCVVMPEQDAVLAITAGEMDMQRILNLVWKHLRSGMHEGVLPTNVVTDAALSERLAALALTPMSGAATSSTAAHVTGRRYTFPANPQGITAVTLHFEQEDALLTVVDQRGEHLIRCGYSAWRTGKSTFNAGEMQPVAASGAWRTPDLFALQLAFYTTPFCPQITCHFEGDRLHFQMEMNVDFVSCTRPQLTGQGLFE